MSGDGKTEKTAYFFTEARTTTEHIRLAEQYWSNKEEIITGKRYRKETMDFKYDIYPMKNGDVWFKVPKMDINEIDKYTRLKIDKDRSKIDNIS